MYIKVIIMMLQYKFQRIRMYADERNFSPLVEKYDDHQNRMLSIGMILDTIT
jgi:hypothetical protein